MRSQGKARDAGDKTNNGLFEKSVPFVVGKLFEVCKDTSSRIVSEARAYMLPTFGPSTWPRGAPSGESDRR